MLDVDQRRLSHLYDIYHGGINTLYSNVVNLEQSVLEADIVIGAVLVPGARAPMLVTRELVAAMKRGSVIVDVAVDQGGCVETIHPTSPLEPDLQVDGVIHYGVRTCPAPCRAPRRSRSTTRRSRTCWSCADRGVDAALQANARARARRQLLPRAGDTEGCRRRPGRAARRRALGRAS